LPKEEVSNAGDAIQSIDPTVSMFMERVVQLSLGRAAGLRIETDNPSHKKFSRKFVQDPEENHKKDVKLIANSLSRDLIQIINALCNYSLDMAQAAGKDLSPFDCLQDVRDGNIPMHLAVEKLRQVPSVFAMTFLQPVSCTKVPREPKIISLILLRTIAR
jgi:NACalpha-BTF3-like transcription factor